MNSRISTDNNLGELQLPLLLPLQFPKKKIRGYPAFNP
jgi:hypothetical protein